MPTDKITRRDDQVRFTGRILFLTEDTSLIRQQLEAIGAEAKTLEDELARRLMNDDLPLMNNISTDEITPGWVCFYYDETLGQYVYVALRDGAVKKDEVKNGGFAVVVSGLSKGCGSSRETAPYAEKWAGIQLVIARSIEKIYGQNSQNIGLLTSTDFGLIERIRRGEEIALAEFTSGLDPISQSIVERTACGSGRAGFSAPDEHRREDHRASCFRKSGRDRRRSGEARRCFVRGGRCPLLARIRYADGRVALDASARAGRESDRARIRLRVSRSPDFP